MTATEPGLANVVTESDGAREGLSQFVARILDQLSLAAWLPSAALVMMSTLTVQLAVSVDETPKASVGKNLSDAFTAIGGISVGGGALLFGAVVVLTMVTQAFSFEAIRYLEGYWGTNRVIELLADTGSRVQLLARRWVLHKKKKLKERTWNAIERQITAQRKAAEANGGSGISAEVAKLLGASYLQVEPHRTPTDLEAMELVELLNGGEIERQTPSSSLRRLRNLDKRLRDFATPPDMMMPTRFGNILRSFEDRTGEDRIESFIDEHFDQLPPAMQRTHDHRRTRLDLYASMVMVSLLSGLLGVLLLRQHSDYALGALTTSLALGLLNYRAAIASARAYGPILITVVNEIRRQEQAKADLQQPVEIGVL